MLMPDRKFSSTSEYRYGFNGQESSGEVASNTTTALYWEYDGRIGRRWNIDPKQKVEESPYLTFNGNPILLKDVLGDKARDWVGKKNKDGTFTPEWDGRVKKKGDEAEGDMYLGKDYTLTATDGKTYHLMDNNQIEIVPAPTNRQGGSAGAPNQKAPSAEPKKPETPVPPSSTPTSPDGDPFGKDKKKFLSLLANSKPDFITFSISAPLGNLGAIKPLSKLKDIPPYFSTSFNVANDRYGNLYYTPISAGIGSPGNSGNIMLNYMFNPTTPQELKSFLTGVSYSFSGGNIVGGALTTNQSFSQWSLGVGVTTKGASVSTANQPALFINEGAGLKW
jgi:hypothetical protein